MKTKRTQSGVTLMEMMVVVSAVALLTVFSMPAIKSFVSSQVSSPGSVKGVIGAALSSARAIAAKEQRYAGVRFQKVYEPNDPVNADQYMVFIIHNKLNTGPKDKFKAVEGLKPIKLSERVGVMDLLIKNSSDTYPITSNSDIDEPNEVIDTTTFSIIFSPSGKLAMHTVILRNREGDYMPVNLTDSSDDIFNSIENIVNNNTGMFIQDDYEFFLYEESSRNSFIIYDRDEFKKFFEKGTAWTEYLYDLSLEPIYVNPYTGKMISVE